MGTEPSRYEKEIEDIVNAQEDFPEPTNFRRGYLTPIQWRHTFSIWSLIFSRLVLRFPSAKNIMLLSFGLMLITLILWGILPTLGAKVLVVAIILFIAAYFASFLGNSTTSRYEKKWRGQPVYQPNANPGLLQKLFMLFKEKK